MQIYALVLHIQAFLNIETRRELAANLSPLTSLDNPYRATLEEVSENSVSGWLLVNGELDRMHEESQISTPRFGKLQRHLRKITEQRCAPSGETSLSQESDY